MKDAVSRFTLGGMVALLAAGGLVMTSCQGRNASDNAGTPTAPEAVAPSEPAAPPAAVTPEPEVAPEPTTPSPAASPEPVAQAPTTTPTTEQAGSTLPDALKRQWEPASNVLFTFGSMTVTPDQVQWGSGQTSAYTVVSTDGGYLLQLQSNPTFYETQNPYIKLIPKGDAAGATTSIDVAFYESEAKANSNEYIMYGSYFVE